MSSSEPHRPSDRISQPAQRLLVEARSAAVAGWRVFWKATQAVGAVLFVSFFTLHSDELRGPILRVAWSAILMLGYCLYYGAWVGLAAAVLAVCWRYAGAWMLLPMLGSLLGAGSLAALAWAVFWTTNVESAGVHGGGEAAAMVLLAMVVLAAAAGAALGGLIFAVLAFLLARRRRRRS